MKLLQKFWKNNHWVTMCRVFALILKHVEWISSRVLVLENGLVREFDSPKRLLENPRSLFYSLAKESGIVWSGNCALKFIIDVIYSSEYITSMINRCYIFMFLMLCFCVLYVLHLASNKWPMDLKDCRMKSLYSIFHTRSNVWFIGVWGIRQIFHASW